MSEVMTPPSALTDGELMMLIASLEEPYFNPLNRGVDMVALSNRETSEQFRRYIELSREFRRRSRKPAL